MRMARLRFQPAPAVRTSAYCAPTVSVALPAIPVISLLPVVDIVAVGLLLLVTGVPEGLPVVPRVSTVAVMTPVVPAVVTEATTKLIASTIVVSRAVKMNATASPAASKVTVASDPMPVPVVLDVWVLPITPGQNGERTTKLGSACNVMRC